MVLHSPVRSKWAKLDVDSEIKGITCQRLVLHQQNKKANTVIIYENSSVPDMWIEYRDKTAGNEITLYADSKTLILNPPSWLCFAENLPAFPNLLSDGHGG